MAAIGREYLKRFRFSLIIPGLDPIQQASPPWSLSGIYSDPFQRDRIWLCQAHTPSLPCLIEPLREQLRQHDIGKVAVDMLDREGHTSRRIAFTYRGIDWLPFELDAMSEGYAMDQVVVTGVRYADPVTFVPSLD